jgi:hypothetical protein
LFSHQVLPYAIQRLQGAGYRLVTVAECLGMPAYQSVGNPGTPDVRGHLSLLTDLPPTVPLVHREAGLADRWAIIYQIAYWTA